MVLARPPSPSPSWPRHRAPHLEWVQHPGETVARAVGDALLSIATLGMSRFWTTTLHRRRVWSSVRIDNQPLRYTGTPTDLALPAIFAVLGATLSLLIMYKMFGLKFDPAGGLKLPNMSGVRFGRLTYMVPLLMLIGMARYRARHFILRRVWLGDIGGRMTGRPFWFGPRHLFTTLAMAPTLFWIAPFRSVWLHAKLVGETEIAGERMHFEPRYRALYAKFAFAWLGLISIYLAINVALAATAGSKIVMAVQSRSWPAFTPLEWLAMGLIGGAGLVAFATVLAWYQAHETLHLWRATRWRGQTFELALAPRALVRLMLENLAIRLLSLGMLDQVAVTRTMKVMAEAIRLVPAPVSANVAVPTAASGNLRTAPVRQVAMA